MIAVVIVFTVWAFLGYLRIFIQMLRADTAANTAPLAEEKGENA